MFPVTQVDSLNKLSEASEGGRLIVMDHIVPDPFHETIICLPKECSFTPMDACCELGELDKIFSSLWFSCIWRASSLDLASPTRS